MRLLRSLILVTLTTAAAIGLVGYWWANHPLRVHSAPVDFRVAPGSTLRMAAQQVADAGVDLPPIFLVVFAKVMRAETGIKAGSYTLNEGVTPWQILSKLVRGKVTQGDITLVEGWSLCQWRDKVDSHPDLLHDSRGLSDKEIIDRLGLEAPSLEGLLFPDTYLFDKQSSDFDLFARAARAMRKKLASEWEGRAPGLPFKDPYQALTLASIIEKETGRLGERPVIAAVFVNRLRAGMLLQTDPTVIYGLGEKFDGNLRKRDLTTDTPYNTYTRPGLPPTPIAMPSLASLQAALHPADSDALYFVARGDGGSHFSRNLEEHTRAVNRYQKGNK